MTMVAGDSDVEAAIPTCILFFPIYNEKKQKEVERRTTQTTFIVLLTSSFWLSRATTGEL
jgi:hypothetical protein